MRFGTDGIRGRFGGPVLNAGVARQLGAALYEEGARRLAVVRDTRSSGPALLRALVAGFAGTVVDYGVQPTAGLSVLLARGEADLGVAITASHNPAQDNGLKLLGPDGRKLSVEQESRIAARTTARQQPGRLEPGDHDHAGAVRACLPEGRWLQGVKVALDCANGAAARIGPALLRELGAQVVAIGVSPDGANINEGLGAVHPRALASVVRARGADVGLCLDGDADRCILIDGEGVIVDGDALLLLLARPPGVVGTVMCNAALPRALAARGLDFDRVGVGDRLVAERMRERGWPVGGEPSGHVLLQDGLPTGDGLLTGLRVLAGGVDLATRLQGWSPDPQVNINLTVRQKPPLSTLERTRAAVADAEAQGAERVLLRYSGTEPKLRILVEARRSELAQALAELIAEAARAELGS